MLAKKEKALSDHAPYTIENENHYILVWNMLNKMCRKDHPTNSAWSYLNNGFGCVLETDEQYSARIEIIARKVLAFLNSERKPTAICLQEGPIGDFYDMFKGFFESSTNYKFLNKTVRADNLITIFNSEHYDECLELTEEFNKLNDTLTIAKPEGGLKDRVLMTVLKNKKTEETTLIINVHADFQKNIDLNAAEIHKKASELRINHIHFVGDGNRDPLITDRNDRCLKDISNKVKDGTVNINDTTFYVYALPSSSFIRRLDNDLQLEIETRDLVLSNEKYNLKFAKHIYTHKDLDNKLSPDLLKFPEKLIENLSQYMSHSTENLSENLLSM